MHVQFGRTKIMNTTFRDEHGKLVLRTETTFRLCVPLTTQIFRIISVSNKDGFQSEKNGAEYSDQWESERILATINWVWPSQTKSTVNFEGRTMSLAEALEPGRGCLK